ncbi:uncharacterized protein G2W53_041084 [Senna tora]|uniref:Uncharacterized protein n=1 Tax=Senna tora TaxID=362788 RepID=A0A834SGU4_9FABA|nr:uncharacterized protein G2W53_041084 [Senna tora]
MGKSRATWVVTPASKVAIPKHLIQYRATWVVTPRRQGRDLTCPNKISGWRTSYSFGYEHRGRLG